MRARITFRNRRRIAIMITAVAIAAVWSTASYLDARLARPEIFTGASLLGTLMLLMLIGVRRRIPFVPLGNVSTWTQIHIYSGIFAGGVYVIHAPAMIAGGPLEFTLSLLFISVTLSGLYGVFASRMLPRRLTVSGEQTRFDLVDWHRQQLAGTARNLLENLHEQSAIRVLGRFYSVYLNPFFSAGPSLAFVVAPTSIRRRRLLSGLQQLDRYLETEGRETAGALAALVRRRDELDYQYALQLRLRTWVVVHAVLSLLLLGLSIAHAGFALRYMS